MNRIDRLFAILLLLQRKRLVRAQDLAAAFEVSERTIYRDMDALCETGVPILALPGAGYELMEGYYLPPLLFSAAEATALFLGGKMLMAHTTGRVAIDAEHALAKITVALPKDTREEVERLTEILSFFATGRRFDLYEKHLATLQQAIRQRRVVRLTYHSYSQDETTVRDIEPHRLFYLNGMWYVEGYCRLRNDYRGFRLNRVEDVCLLPEVFQARSEEPAPREWVTARVRVAAHMVRWVRERQHYGYRDEEPVPGSDDVVMRYEVNALSELASWIMGWGAAVEPLEPPELREAVRLEALKVVEQLA